MKKAQWLRRDLITGPYLTLCLSPEAFAAAMRHLDIEHPKDRWIRNDHSDATTHHCVSQHGEQCAVICLRVKPDYEPIGVAALLVHEAVHVFQAWCENRGEDSPSSEFEAYSIQHISQQLMLSYAEQTK